MGTKKNYFFLNYLIILKLNYLLQFSSFLVLEDFSRHKQTATTNKPHQQPFAQTCPSVFSSGAFRFLLCFCPTPSPALLTSVRSLVLLLTQSPPLKKGVMSGKIRLAPVNRDLKHQDGRWRRGRHIRVKAEARPPSRFTRLSMLSNTATAT